MTSGGNSVVRWLFESGSSPDSNTQAEGLARGVFDRELTPTPRTWHPSLGASLEEDLDYGIGYEMPDATIIDGPWLRRR